MKIGRIAFLKLAFRRALCLCALVPGLNEVARDIDARHVRSESRRWQCRRFISASEIQDSEAFCNSESLDERLSALSHTLCNTSKVAFSHNA